MGIMKNTRQYDSEWLRLKNKKGLSLLQANSPTAKSVEFSTHSTPATYYSHIIKKTIQIDNQSIDPFFCSTSRIGTNIVLI